MYNWSGRSNKEKEVLFIQKLLGRDTSMASLAQYGEFVPVEGSTEGDNELLYYKNIVESVEITGSLADNPSVSDTKVIDFVVDNTYSGYTLQYLTEAYGVSSSSTSYSGIQEWVSNPATLSLDKTHPYLWNKTTITLSDDTTDSSYKLIGSIIVDPNGGPQTARINSVTEFYAIYPYNTNPPAEGSSIWVNRPPISELVDNRYIWNYDIVSIEGHGTQGGYPNAMIIGDYGNQLREVKFKTNIHESDYDINSSGVIVAPDLWWKDRSRLGLNVEWDHVAEITQLQINDVIIIRGIAQVQDPDDPTQTIDCDVLINSKVSQINNSATQGEYKVKAFTLNYVMEEIADVSADLSQLKREVEELEDKTTDLRSQVIGLNIAATQSLSDGILTKEEQDSFKLQLQDLRARYDELNRTCQSLDWSTNPNQSNKQYVKEYELLVAAYNDLCADYSGTQEQPYTNVGKLAYICDPLTTSGVSENITGILVDNEGIAILDSQGKQQGKFSSNTRGLTVSALTGSINNFNNAVNGLVDKVNLEDKTNYTISTSMSEFDLALAILTSTVTALGDTMDASEKTSITNQLARIDTIYTSIITEYDNQWSTTSTDPNYVPEYAAFKTAYTTLKTSADTIKNIEAGSSIPASAITNYNTSYGSLSTAIDNLEDYYIASSREVTTIKGTTEKLIDTLDSDITNLATILNSTRGTLSGVFADYVIDKSEQQSLRLQISSYDTLYNNVAKRAESLGWNIPTGAGYSYFNAVKVAYEALVNNVYQYDPSASIPNNIDKGLLTKLSVYPTGYEFGYKYGDAFYRDTDHTQVIPGDANKVYRDNTDSASVVLYKYDASASTHYTSVEDIYDDIAYFSGITFETMEDGQKVVNSDTPIGYKVDVDYVSVLNAWVAELIRSCEYFDKYVDNYQYFDTLIPQISLSPSQSIYVINYNGSVESPPTGVIRVSLIKPDSINVASTQSNLVWKVNNTIVSYSDHPGYIDISVSSYSNVDEIKVTCENLLVDYTNNGVVVSKELGFMSSSITKTPTGADFWIVTEPSVIVKDSNTGTLRTQSATITACSSSSGSVRNPDTNLYLRVWQGTDTSTSVYVNDYGRVRIPPPGQSLSTSVDTYTIKLYNNNSQSAIELDTESIQVIPTGANGAPHIEANLTNGSGQVPTDKDGNPTIAQPLESTSIVLYKGGDLVTNLPSNAYSYTPHNCTLMPTLQDHPEMVRISDMNGDSASVDMTITYNGQPYTKTFPIIKLRQGIQGNPGTPGVAYWLEQSASIVTRDVNSGNTLSPDTITVTAKMNSAGSTSVFTGATIKVYGVLGSQQTEISGSTSQGIRSFDPTGDYSSYVIVLYNGSTELDRESIPVVNFGANGSSVAIANDEIMYNQNSSPTQPPPDDDEHWDDDIPIVTPGNYLWTRTIIEYSDGTVTESYSVSYKAEDGTNVTIRTKSVTYQEGSSGTQPPTGTWLPDPPPVSSGKYLWTKTYVKYSTGDETESYSVSYAGKDGESAIYADLDNDSAQVTCDAEGKQGVYTGAKTNFRIYEGKPPVAFTGLTSSQVPAGAATYTVTYIKSDPSDPHAYLDMTRMSDSVDSVAITISGTYKGVVYSKVFTVVKQKQGITGDVGPIGASVHFLESTYSGTQSDLSLWGTRGDPSLSGSAVGWKLSGSDPKITSGITNVYVGDTCWVKCTNTDKSGTTYVGFVVAEIRTDLNYIKTTQSGGAPNGGVGIIDKGDQGQQGVNASSYWIEKSTPIVSQDVNNGNALTPDKVTVTAKVNTNGTTSTFTTGYIKIWDNPQASGDPVKIITNGNGNFDPQAGKSSYLIKLFPDSTHTTLNQDELDTESVTIVKTGEDGVNAIVAVLTNDSAQAPSSNTGSVDPDLNITTTIKLYDGGTEITSGLTYSHTASYCTIDSSTTATIQVTGVMTDSAYVNMTVTYNSIPYTKVFTITKQKNGNPALLWDFSANKDTYKRNLRNKDASQGTEIQIIPNKSGYDYEPVFKVASPARFDNNNKKLFIPYDNTVDSVILYMNSDDTSTPAKSYSYTFNVEDETSYGHDYGLCGNSSVPIPSSNSNPPLIYADNKPKDYFTFYDNAETPRPYPDYINGEVYEWKYDSSTPPVLKWIPSDNTEYLLTSIDHLTQTLTKEQMQALNNPNTISFFNRIVANSITAKTIKGISGVFDEITITGKSELQGKVINPVFQTLLENEPGSTYKTNIGSTSTGDIYNGKAEGVLGSDVKSYLNKIANSKLSANDLSTYNSNTSITNYNANGLLPSIYTVFNKIIRISSVSPNKTLLSSFNNSKYNIDSSCSYTNNLFKSESIYVDYSPKSLKYNYYSGDALDWVFDHTTKGMVGTYRPAEYINYKDPSELSESDLGTKYYYNYNFEQIEEEGDHYWQWDTDIYVCDYVSELYEDVVETGTVIVNVGGSITYDPTPGQAFTVLPRQTITVSMPSFEPEHEPVEGTVQNYRSGSASLKWISADHYSNGTYLYHYNYGNNILISSLPDDIWFIDCRLKVTISSVETIWLDLPINNNRSTWTYDTNSGAYTYGKLYKLVRFKWSDPDHKPSTLISPTQFDDSEDNHLEAVGYNVNGNSIIDIPSHISAEDITSIQLSPDFISYYSYSTLLLTISTDSFVRMFTTNIPVISKSKGVYSSSLVPWEQGGYVSSNTYNLGTSTYPWTESHIKTNYSDLTLGNVNGTGGEGSQGEVDPQARENNFKVWRAVFN